LEEDGDKEDDEEDEAEGVEDEDEGDEEEAYDNLGEEEDRPKKTKGKQRGDNLGDQELKKKAGSKGSARVVLHTDDGEEGLVVDTQPKKADKMEIVPG
jgi:hypothetical protein